MGGRNHPDQRIPGRLCRTDFEITGERVRRGAGRCLGGGSIKADELRDKLRPEDTITVITKDPEYHFVPSNRRIAVGWRTRQDVSEDLAPIMAQKGIAFKSIAAETRIPQENRAVLVDGTAKPEKALPFALSMILPAFRGIPALRGIEGLSNPRGFTIVDAHQRNPTYRSVFAVGVCVAIPPMGPTPVACGVPKTGFMTESMVTATAHNIAALVRGKEPDQVAAWNADCLADFGDSGVAFVAQPQIPPRNINWASHGKWVAVAKIGFEKCVLRNLRLGTSEPFYETLALKALGIDKLKATTKG